MVYKRNIRRASYTILISVLVFGCIPNGALSAMDEKFSASESNKENNETKKMRDNLIGLIEEKVEGVLLSKEKTNKIKGLVNSSEFDVYKDQFNKILKKDNAAKVIYALFNYPDSIERLKVLFSDNSLFNSILKVIMHQRLLQH